MRKRGKEATKREAAKTLTEIRGDAKEGLANDTRLPSDAMVGTLILYLKIVKTHLALSSALEVSIDSSAQLSRRVLE